MAKLSKNQTTEDTIGEIGDNESKSENMLS